jgi:glutamyl-tRNA reductase
LILTVSTARIFPSAVGRTVVISSRRIESTHMALLVVGTSHQTTPLEVREKLAINSSDYGKTVKELCSIDSVEEALILSTCNRTEIYGIVLPDDKQSLQGWLKNAAGLSEEQAEEYIYSRQDAHAVEHLFKVASGLDSMVLGEPQIVGQLKQARQEAVDAGGAGKLLDRLFQHAFSTSKSVRHETGINEHPVSVAYITTVLARQIFGDLSSKKVMLVGAGEMIELCGHHLHQKGVSELIIANRSKDRAEILAQKFDARAIALDAIDEVLHEADIVISSTASSTPVISTNAVKTALKKRRRQPMFLVDIAVPRDIEPTVANLEDAYLYTIDDLQQVADNNTRHRHSAAKSATGLIQSSVEDFMRWLHGARAGKFLKRLRDHAEKSSDELVAKALQQIENGKDPQIVIKQLAGALTNRILHVPSLRLRQAAENQEYGILKAADWLFEIENHENGSDDNANKMEDADKDESEDGES